MCRRLRRLRRLVLNTRCADVSWSAPGRIAFEASAQIHDVLRSFGRTEDVRLSPSNRVVAVVAYFGNRIHLFSIDVELRATPSVRLREHRVLASPAIVEPHGIAFLGDDHLLVCSRGAGVAIFRVPEPEHGDRPLDPVHEIEGRGLLFAKVKTPSSVDGHHLTANRHRILVCNGQWNFVSSHTIHLGSPIEVRHHGNLVDPRIRIPDGVTMSHDGSCFAVSNHADGEVLVYANNGAFSPRTGPVAALQGMVCPHGLRLLSDGTMLVADASTPYLHVFARSGPQWRGTHLPAKSIRMLDDDAFYDGRYDTREGGIKGLDVDRSERLLVTTRLGDPLAFYDLPALLAAPGETPSDAELRRQRDEALEARDRRRLARRWTFSQRVREAVRQRRQGIDRRRQDARATAWVWALRARAVVGPSLLDPRGPVVSLTSHARRLEHCHVAIEAIGSGRLRPSRIVLWITDAQVYAKMPVSLRRLQARGLEVRMTREYGPHTKYWACVEAGESIQPLVTADDDALYSGGWLADLWTAWKARPHLIHAHRVRRMKVFGRELTPYVSWPFVSDSRPNHANFITGVGGVIYPPPFLAFLAQRGTGFTDCCPTADDIWLTVNAIRAGIEVAQVGGEAYQPVLVPGSQETSLYSINVLEGMNQRQLRRTFRPEDLEIVRRAHP